MNKKILCAALLWLTGLPAAGHSQVSIDSSLADLPVRAIVMHGNDRTRDRVILREMKQKTGAPLDPALVHQDQKRLLNLNIFNRVIIMGEPYKEGALLRVMVSEMWYIYPFPILYINDKDWSKFSYGAGINRLNWRGNNETLGLAFWLGYDPGLQLNYTNPWFGGNLGLYTTLGISLSRVRSKHYEERVNEDQASGAWSIGKRFGYHTLVSLDLGARRVSFTPPMDGGTLSTDGTDQFITAGLRFQWDRRDLAEYPHSGWLTALAVSKRGMPGGSVDYWRAAADLRAYLPLGSATMALRSASVLSAGTVPVYDRIYLGYSERVRGHFNDRREGENRSLTSAALRFPLLPVRYLSLAGSPYLKDLKFGISMALFADAGLTWNRYEQPAAQKIIAGYGVGLHFHLPYVNLIRLELAFNEQRRRQFILDLYTAF